MEEFAGVQLNEQSESKKKQKSYSTFSLDLVRRQFDLTLLLEKFFTEVAPIIPSELLKASLARAGVNALVSEKARSEFIVAPILLEVKEFLKNTVSVYSGVRLDVAPEEGLQGICDFIVSKSPPLPTLQTPLIVMVEAKKNDIEEGLGQCAAEMVAALRLNQMEGLASPSIYGCVTTGELWQFLALEAKTLKIDPERIYIEHVDKILGILIKMAT